MRPPPHFGTNRMAVACGITVAILVLVMCATISIVMMPLTIQTLLQGTTIHTKEQQQFQKQQPLLPDFKTSAYKCPETIKVTTTDRQLFRSQSQEDVRLFNLFPNLCGGRYIEFGALDGQLYSNSHAFHFGLQWKGVLIEIGPRNYEQLKVNRPNELAVVNAGVCKQRQTLHYVEQGPTGGIWEFMTPEFKAQWFPRRTIENTQEFLCHPLQEILDIHLSSPNATTTTEAATTTTTNSASDENVAPSTSAIIQYFDFLSVDVEGAEIQALESIDFSRTGFGIILCEASDLEGKNVVLQTFLKKMGYRYLERYQRSDWFVNEEFYNIYDGLIV